MKGIQDILSEYGITEHAEDIAKAVNENYKTVAEVTRLREKLADAEKRLEDANAAIEQAKATDTGNAEELEKLKAKLADYEKAEDERRAKATESEKREKFAEDFKKALNGREFANRLVADKVTEDAYKLMSQNPDMTAEEALGKAVTDEDGVWKNPQRDPKKMPASTGSGSTGGITSLDELHGKSNEYINEHWNEISQLLANQK